MLISAPLDVPVIDDHVGLQNSILHATVGTPMVLTCRADYVEPPFLLMWTNETEERLRFADVCGKYVQQGYTFRYA